MKNLLVISSSYPSRKYPVSGTFVEKLLVGLARDYNFDFKVYSPRRVPRTLLKDIPLNGQYRNMPIVYPRYIDFGSLAKVSPNLSDLSLRNIANRIYLDVRRERRNYDLIYCHFLHPNGMIAFYLSQRLNIPFVINLGESSFSNIPKRLKNLATKAFSESTKVLAVSSHVKQGVLEYTGVNRQVDVVFNGIDHALFQKQDKLSAINALGIRNKGITVSFIGSLSERKGFPSLVRAINLLRERKIDISLIVATSSKLATCDSVTFCQLVPQAQLPFFLSASDIFVFPSIAEGMPNAVLEAAAVGLAIVLVDTPFNREILPFDAAYYIKDNSKESIEEALNYLVNNKNAREGLASKAKECSMKFSLSERVKNVYESLKDASL